MRTILLFILLISSSSVWAQKTLSKEAFQGNVRPVLNGIINDFYQMVSLFPDFPKEIINLVDTMKDLGVEKENLRIGCPRILTKKCLGAIDNIRGKLSALEATTLKLSSEQRPPSALYLNGIGGMRLIMEYSLSLSRIKGQLDNSSFLIRGQIPIRRDTYRVIKELDELNTLLSLAVVEYVPYNYKEDFRHFFFNFVHPIQLNISKNQNFEFLNRNLNSLNFALNLLNMNLTKRNKKTPEGMAPFLALIHNRWNGLLRYYF